MELRFSIIIAPPTTRGVPLSRILNDITVRALYFFNWVTREKAPATSLKLLCNSFFFFYRTTAIHVCHWFVGKRLDSIDRILSCLHLTVRLTVVHLKIDIILALRLILSGNYFNFFFLFRVRF